MKTQVGTMENQKAYTKNIYLFYRWVIIFLCASFLFYKYIMQVSPSVMTAEWMRAFNISATGLGNLAATFFASYMITQLFVGVLLDRFSPRILSGCAILTSALGTLLFAESTHLSSAVFSRTLMGIGAAFATVSYMKLTANWFRPERFAVISGLLATAAMLGGVAGQGLTWLIDAFGWRYTLLVCGWFGVGLGLAFILLVRNKPSIQLTPYAEQEKFGITFKDFAKILSNGQNWLLTFYSGLAFSPVAVLGGLWGNPFISEAYNLTPKQTSTVVMMIFWGLAVGGPLLGLLSDKLANRRRVMAMGALLSFVSVTLVIYVNALPIPFLKGLLFLFGFGTGAFMLGFAIGKEINALAFAATVIALINTGDAIFGAITEPLIGKFLDLTWTGTIKAGIHYYGVTEYKWALLVLPLYLLAALTLVFFIKESHGQQLSNRSS